MKNFRKLLLPLLGLAVVATQLRAEHQLTNPTVAGLARDFSAPPSAYSSQVTWGWSGVITREVITRDLDKLQAMNIQQAWVDPGRNPER